MGVLHVNKQSSFRPSTLTISLVALYLVLIVASAILVPYLPERFPIHFGLGGEPDGFTSPLIGALFQPVNGLVILVLVSAVPYWGRHATKRAEFYRSTFPIIQILVAAFPIVMQAYILVRALGVWGGQVNPVSLAAVVPLVLAPLLPRTPRNGLFGVRTPWSLKDDETWRKSQILGARLFAASGGIALLGFAFPAAAFWLLIVPIVLSAIILIPYSRAIYLVGRSE